MIVFKEKTENRLEKKLQNNIHVKNKEILVKCQDNAWVNNEIFNFWLNNVWFPYCNEQKECILFLDITTSHYSDGLIKNFINNNITFILIPPGLTRYLQPSIYLLIFHLIII